MEKQFSSAPLTRRGARAAYSLVRLHDDSITFAAWLQFTRQFWSAAEDRKGLTTIRDCRDIVHALYSYHIRSGLIGRKCLCITNLIVARLPGFEIDHAVHESARQLASDLECQTISIEQPFQPHPPAGNLIYHLPAARIFQPICAISTKTDRTGATFDLKEPRLHWRRHTKEKCHEDYRS
jgi:hypothetical protein